jgi:hypothetical protein
MSAMLASRIRMLMSHSKNTQAPMVIEEWMMGSRLMDALR